MSLQGPRGIGWILCLALLQPGCGRSAGQDSPEAASCMYNGVDTCQGNATRLTLTVKPGEVHQTIHSFGASDAWTTKFIGKWASTEKKNRIADLLFSMDTLDDGSPKGIGLSLWRFNIGAGSFAQGEASGIATDWRREECFLNADGTYDWSREAGQQWFLDAARLRGVAYTVGFANSPPVFMTRNGKAFSPGGNSLNIAAGRAGDYADFLVKVADHFHFDYISPVNEPQWDWKAGDDGKASQEGSPATDSDIASLTRLLSKRLVSAGSKARVTVAEAGQWDFLYGRNTDGRGDQIASFFDASSPDYIGALPGVSHVLSAHSYFTTCPSDALMNTRQAVADERSRVDPSLETWMTEFGVLGDICGQLNGYPRHTGIAYGLYVARVMFADLTVAGVSSWQWWLAVNPYDYSDGLVYIDDPSGGIAEDKTKTDGIVVSSKQLWAMGNYSRFVRPGMERIEAYVESSGSVPADLLVSAYRDAATRTLVVVAVNEGAGARVLSLDQGGGVRVKGGEWNTYSTTADENLKRGYASVGACPVPAQSVVTLTGTYE